MFRLRQDCNGSFQTNGGQTSLLQSMLFKAQVSAVRKRHQDKKF